jgi:hypothetical protein
VAQDGVRAEVGELDEPGLVRWTEHDVLDDPVERKVLQELA